MKLTIINGSVSDSSSSARLATRIVETLPPSTEATWVNLRDLAHPMVDSLLTGFPTGGVQEAITAVEEADAILAVSPTYQASYSGLFKMFVDLLPENAMTGKPVLLSATGGTGRHSLVVDHALRPLFAYLGALPAPTAIYATTQDWGAPGLETEIGLDESLESRVSRGAQQLWDLHAALNKRGRSTEVVEDEDSTAEAAEAAEAATAAETFPGFVDFQTLLNREGGR